MTTRWVDPAAAWWAKAARARKHLEDLSSMVSRFDPATAYEIHRAPAEEPGTAALRFIVHRTVPTEILTTIGDALHNMRSCLDSVAFELARRHLGDQMTGDQERAVQFPIRETRAEFDKFLARPDQRSLYGQAERAALKCVQPFAIPEEAIGAGATMATTPREDFQIDHLARLSHLNNLDKHRYLPLLAWQPDPLAYFHGDVPGTTLRLKPAGRTGFANGDVIGHVTFSDGNWEHAHRLVLRMNLCLADDLSRGGEFTQALEHWHDYLIQWALQRIFIVAEGNPPPIAIGL